MENSKRIFFTLIKYHDTITKILIRHDKIYKENDSFVSSENREIEDKDSDYYSDYYPSKLFTTKNGIKKICKSSAEIFRTRQFAKIVQCDTTMPLMERFISEGIKVYQSKFENASFFCKKEDIEKILLSFYKDIIYIEIPNGIRLSSNVRQQYVDILNRQIDWLKSKNFKHSCAYFYMSKIGESESGRIRSTQSFLNKYGIFAYTPIYDEIEWDFGFLDKNKHSVNWSLVIEHTNMCFNESILCKYNDYIPYSDIQDYSIFGNLSWDFILNHIDKFEFKNFCSTANIKFTSEQLIEFYNYYAKQETPNFYSNHELYEDDIIRLLLKNSNCEWSGELLKQASILQPYATLSECISNKKLNKLLISTPYYLDFYNSLIEIEKNKCINKINNHEYNGYYGKEGLKNEIEMYSEFWLRFNNLGKAPFDTYKDYFTIKNILKYKTDWEKILQEYSHTIRNTWDSLFFMRNCMNKWDMFANNMSIKLTNELCEFLYSMKIKAGGYYITEDGKIIEDHRLQEHNALEFFCNHSFSNVNEMNLVSSNPDLLMVFLEKSKETDIPLINFIIEDFFKDFPIEDYLYIVNKFSDE